MSKDSIISNKTIVFFLDTKKEIAETQRIFIDLSLYLYKTGYDVLYINNTHKKDLDNTKELKNIFRDINRVDFSKLDEAIFFVPVNYLMHLLSRIYFLNNAKICLYMHDESAIKYLSLNMNNCMSENQILDLICDTKSCAFINKSIVPTRLKDELEDLVVIPYSVFKSKKWFEEKISGTIHLNKTSINIGFFGNINSLVNPSIENIILNVSKCGIDKKIVIHLIGNTSAIPDADLNTYNGDRISIVLTGDLSEEEKIEYAINNVDIAFANNYQAVNIAAASIPTFIPIIDTKHFLGNRYVKIDDVINLDFGWNCSSILLKDYDCYTMNHIIHDFLYNKKSIGEQESQFINNNCSIELAANNFVKLINNSVLDLKYLLDCYEIKNLMKKYSQYGQSEKYDDFMNSFKEKNNDQEKYNRSTTILFRNKIKTLLKKIFPHLYYQYKNKKFLDVQKSYSSKIKQIHNVYLQEQKIKVGFLVIFSSVFPARPVFELMCQMKEFDPYIIVIPNVSGSLKKQRDLLNETYSELAKEYDISRIIKAYDIESDTYLDLKSDYNILFFCNPYKTLVHTNHEIEYFLDKPVLPLYVSYGFAALSFWDEVVSLDFYNYLWKACVETPSNLEHLKQVERIKGKNGIVTGYVKADGINDIIPSQRTRKRILICPHHTVWGWKNLDISNFMKYMDFFVELPTMYPNIDFVFRPHPLLIPNLKEHLGWSQQQVDDYLNKLLANSNMSYDTSGDYYQQFIDSDAMIHDCGSFIAEYLYTGNPCCYMMKSKEKTYEGLIPFGKKCMDQYYHAFSKEDIINFINNCIIKGEDPLKKQREEFVEKELKYNYPNAAKTVIDMLKKELKIK